MRLTQWTDYSLRVLMYCGASAGRDKPVTIAEIAQAHGISRSHLTKGVMTLSAQGYLETSRGRGGGLKLMRPAGEIRLGEVVRQGEGDCRLLECFDPAVNTCRLDGRCRLKGVVQGALDSFLAHLDRFTLADLIFPASALPVPLMPAGRASF